MEQVKRRPSFGVDAVAPDAPVIDRAVSLDYLVWFTEQHDLWKLTTKEVVDKFIIPPTQPSKEDYIQHTKPHEGIPQAWIGRVTVFVSHAWSACWGLLVKSLQDHDSNRVKAGCPREFYWVDIFAINQHTLSTTPVDELLAEVLNACTTVCLVFDSWKKPLMISRCWCLFEIANSVQAERELEVVMPVEERLLLRKNVTSDMAGVMRTIESIDAREAEAFKQSDKEMIFRLIESGMGFDNFNRIVRKVLNNWLAESVTIASKLHRTPPSADEIERESRLVVRLLHRYPALDTWLYILGTLLVPPIFAFFLVDWRLIQDGDEQSLFFLFVGGPVFGVFLLSVGVFLQKVKVANMTYEPMPRWAQSLNPQYIHLLTALCIVTTSVAMVLTFVAMPSVEGSDGELDLDTDRSLGQQLPALLVLTLPMIPGIILSILGDAIAVKAKVYCVLQKAGDLFFAADRFDRAEEVFREVMRETPPAWNAGVRAAPVKAALCMRRRDGAGADSAEIVRLTEDARTRAESGMCTRWGMVRGLVWRWLFVGSIQPCQWVEEAFTGQKDRSTDWLAPCLAYLARGDLAGSLWMLESLVEHTAEVRFAGAIDVFPFLSSLREDPEVAGELERIRRRAEQIQGTNRVVASLSTLGPVGAVAAWVLLDTQVVKFFGIGAYVFTVGILVPFLCLAFSTGDLQPLNNGHFASIVRLVLRRPVPRPNTAGSAAAEGTIQTLNPLRAGV